MMAVGKLYPRRASALQLRSRTASCAVLPAVPRSANCQAPPSLAAPISSAARNSGRVRLSANISASRRSGMHSALKAASALTSATIAMTRRFALLQQFVTILYRDDSTNDFASYRPDSVPSMSSYTHTRGAERQTICKVWKPEAAREGVLPPARPPDGAQEAGRQCAQQARVLAHVRRLLQQAQRHMATRQVRQDAQPSAQDLAFVANFKYPGMHNNTATVPNRQPARLGGPPAQLVNGQLVELKLQAGVTRVGLLPAARWQSEAARTSCCCTRRPSSAPNCSASRV